MYIDDKKAVVFVQKDEYEKMKELANANAEEIEKRASKCGKQKQFHGLKSTWRYEVAVGVIFWIQKSLSSGHIHYFSVQKGNSLSKKKPEKDL